MGEVVTAVITHQSAGGQSPSLENRKNEGGHKKKRRKLDEALS